MSTASEGSAPHAMATCTRHALTSQDVSDAENPKRRRDDDDFDTESKLLNRKRFLRFLKSHELKFGLEPVARDELTGEVTLVVCRFCKHFGREQQPNKQRRSTKNVKYFRKSFRTDQYKQHHEICHCKTWKKYQACSDEDKRCFFSYLEDATSETEGPIDMAQRCKVDLAPGEVWALEPTKEEKKQRRFKLRPLIVEMVLELSVGVVRATAEAATEKQDARRTHESTGTKWCPPKDTFESCALAGSLEKPMYHVVVYSRSQIDCLVKLAAAGLSFRQMASAMQSFRAYAPMLLQDLVSSQDMDQHMVAATMEDTLQRARYMSPQYNEQQTAEYVRLIIAINLNVTSQLLHNCWAFSLILRASMEYAPVRSYLEFRVKVYGDGAMHNVHLVSIPAFESKCKLMMYGTLRQALDAVLPNWRQRLIGVATDGDAQMPARVLDIVAHLQREAIVPVLYRSFSSCHQLDCIVTTFYSSLQGGCFLLVLKELSVYIRSQPELLVRMTPPPVSPEATTSSRSSKKRWVALGKETNWIAAHRDLLFAHLEAKKPPNAPDKSWWLFFAVVDWVATRANETFAQLVRRHATSTDQIEAVADLTRACAAAFHAQSSLSNPLLAVESLQSKLLQSRKDRFAFSKARVITFIMEINAPSVSILNTTEASVVDMAAENLATSGANLVESLLELSTTLSNEQNVSACRGPNDPKVVEFLPPMLPHEFAQLSGRDLTLLLRTYAPVIRSFFTEEAIDLIDDELKALRCATVRESALNAALAKCTDDTSFHDAWALTENRFRLLEGFAGGFATVFSCASISSNGNTSDLAVSQSEMDTARALLADFALEGMLHAQQFPALMALSERI